MNANHQNTVNSNLATTETKIWLPPSYTNNKAPVAPAPTKKGINWGFTDRTVFDWTMLISQVLGAIAIPFVVTVIGLYATQQITQQQVQLSERQHQADQQNALDQQRATILQTYIDNIQDLLLNHNLRGSMMRSAVSILARARTLTSLEGLNPERKGRLVQFLYEAQLIGFLALALDDKAHPQAPIIDLSGANLSGANLLGANLSGTNLLGANLDQADLGSAHLSGAILRNANLSFADLRDVDLSFADLSDYANFHDANLGDANLSHANLSFAAFRYANFYDANLGGANLHSTGLHSTDLRNANFRNADLSDADLDQSDLSGANLNGANLSGADLSDANLSGAILTQQQLDQVHTCRSAILSKGLTCHHNQ